jgi:hypothetical protein
MTTLPCTCQNGPGIRPQVNSRPVETTQVAPTILSVLGLNPAKLTAVQKERTPLLSGIDEQRPGR